jgi:hypothetical protein
MIYFAYGADLNPAQLSRWAPTYRSIGVGRLPGYRLTFPRYSPEWRGALASVEPSPNAAVFGALYEVPADDIPVLHHERGYDPDGPPELNEHLFREVSVRRLTPGDTLSAWTYIAVPDKTAAAMPSPAYLNAMLDGARYHRLPRAYVVVLQATKTA